MLEKLVGRDGGNGIVGRRGAWWRVGVRSGPVQFGGLNPLDALVACELEGDAGGGGQHGVDIDEDLAVDHVAGEVEVLVDLDEEIAHGLACSWLDICITDWI